MRKFISNPSVIVSLARERYLLSHDENGSEILPSFVLKMATVSMWDMARYGLPGAGL